MHPLTQRLQTFLPFSLLFCLPLLIFSQPEPVGIGFLMEIESEVFHGPRQFSICTPQGYTGTDEKYPVLYLLDGKWNFHFVSGLVNQLSSSGDIPPMVVVGIHHENRTKELTPPGPKGPMGNFGGAQQLLSHISEEVHPYLEKNYRIQPYKILAGHSFGGLFSLFAMRENPGFFQAVLSLSPSLGRNDAFEVLEAKAFFEGNSTLPESLYLALGNEGGASYYSTKNYVELISWDRKAPMRFFFDHLDQENHVSMTIPGFWNGLKFVFEGYNLEKLPAELDELFLVEDHYQMLSQRFGYPLGVPEAYYTQFFHEQLNLREWDYAFYILERYRKAYPDSRQLMQAFIDIHTLMGNHEEAEKYRGEVPPSQRGGLIWMNANTERVGRIY